MFKTFQSPNSPIMEGIIDLHNYIFFYLLIVFVFVLCMFYNIITIFYLNQKFPLFLTHVFFRNFCYEIRNVVHLPELETVWTILPSFILILIAVPSFTLLYAMDEVIDPSLTIKAIGNQWFWAYEYSDRDYYNADFTSYMIPASDLKKGGHRLLEVDNPVVLPVHTHIRILVAANDVLHSWAVPSLGLKVDAVPGRLNQLSVFIKKQGVFYGQCSELCGVNHGFMPITIRSVPVDSHYDWWDNLL